MIKINKPQEIPEILKENSAIWTQSLLDAITQYGSYSEIPKEVKEKILKNYRHKDIKEILFTSSHNKCAFCECKPSDGGGYIEIEHFAPKSIYPNKAFEWDNLLPSCKNCNVSKLDHDTISSPIINPTKVDPEEYFTYSGITLKPNSENLQNKVVTDTIEICDLNRYQLFKSRADLLVNLSNYEKTINDFLIEVENADTSLIKKNKIVKLKNSLDGLADLANENFIFSGFCRDYIHKSDVLKKAKEIVTGYVNFQ